MSSKAVTQAWKNAEGSVALSEIAGTPVLDEAILSQVSGGISGYGNIWSISAECMMGLRCDFWNQLGQ